MRRQLGQLAKKEFFDQMRSRLPQFSPEKQDDLPQGYYVFAWDAGKEITCYIALLISQKYDKFDIEIAYSPNKKYPSSCDTDPDETNRNGDACFRLSRLWGERKDPWWEVADPPNWKLIIETGCPLEDQPLEECIPKVRPAVEDAMNRIMEYAVPYFETVLAKRQTIDSLKRKCPQMNAEEYDRFLASVVRTRDFTDLPRVDSQVFEYFGTTRPAIAGRPHRLVEAGAEKFQELLSVLGDQAAILGRPYIPSLCAEGKNEWTPHEEVRAWAGYDQKWLISTLVENIKYGQSSGSFLFSSQVDDRTIEMLSQIRYGPVDDWRFDVAAGKWFDELDRALDDARWTYVPLSEGTPLDFIAVRNDLAPALAEVDERFSKKGWRIGSLMPFGNRYQWPADLVSSYH